MERVKVVVPDKTDRLLLRSGEIWLPLAYLASDIALPVYLNLVSSYVYDKLKGALKGDKNRIRMSAVYKDKKSGITKQFFFEGDLEALQTTIKKFDLNQFLDE